MTSKLGGCQHILRPEGHERVALKAGSENRVAQLPDGFSVIDGNLARATMDLDYVADNGSVLATMVIRVWYESADEAGFRARLVYGDRPSHAPSSTLTTNPNAVVDTVREWLSSLPAALGTDPGQTAT